MQTESSREIAGQDRDELFEALTHRQRRRVLGVLRTAEESLTLTEVALELARREGDGDATDDRLERLVIALYHRHVPKLVASGLVEFDAERETVTLAESVPETAVVETERTLEMA